MEAPLIEAERLRKTFTIRRRAGRLRRTRSVVEAVAGISFAVRAGEMTGYIGPNGAGKSTTIKMLTGILTPSSGWLRVAGLEPTRQRTALARQIGVVFGQRTGLWWDLPLADSFQLSRHLYRLDAARYRARLHRVTELLDLGPLLDTPVRQLSLGQRMRADLAAVLLHEPPILFLDEPTIGLDVISKAAVRGFLAEINREQGTTVVLTTHDLDDIERLCSRLIVIDHGRIVYDGGLRELRDRIGASRTLIVDTAGPLPPITAAAATVVRVEGPRQWLAFPARHSAAALIADITARYEVADLAVREPDIEDIIRHLYGS
jgi:ABC-2 type transport system ATP-binding protein